MRVTYLACIEQTPVTPACTPCAELLTAYPYAVEELGVGTVFSLRYGNPRAATHFRLSFIQPPLQKDLFFSIFNLV